MAEHISKILGAAQSGLQIGSTKSGGLPLNGSEHWVAAIAKLFQVRYLHRWTSAIDGLEAEVTKEWSREIAGLTPNQIRHGLDNLPESWPPTAGEFRALCLGISEAHKENAAAYRDDRIKDPRRMLSSDNIKARYAKGHEKCQELLKTLKSHTKGSI